MTVRDLTWGDGEVRLTFSMDAEDRIRLTGFLAGRPLGAFDRSLPLVEIITADRSKNAGSRYDATELGLDLRYVAHRTASDDRGEVLEVDLRDQVSALRATVRYSLRAGSGVLSSSVTLAHAGSAPAIPVLFVSSLVLGDDAWDCDSTTIHLADNDWLAEARWRSGSFAEFGEPEVDMAAHFGASPRGSLARIGRGTWSTGEHLPMGAMEFPGGDTLLWQVESNGGWRWELSQGPASRPAGSLRLVTSGPSDVEHQWSIVLDDGDEFVTPVTTFAWSTDGFEGALARLTEHRRADRRRYAGDAGLPLIYNDYMNTLNADPTTEKLLPLIAAAGSVGAEIFVVDAGWYSDEPGWWDSVGAWEASTTRFPGGFDEIFHAIRAQGMTPGLWLEPEVVGIHSPVASTLPDDAFFGRHGSRLASSGRYQQDFRHPAVVSRMNAVIDRLVAAYGLGYLKFDYNINPASGTDHHAVSPGEGLLAASRAYLDWIDALHERHPQLIVENCASGGMRSDWLTVSRFALLSTSDQQDALRCAPIAAAATTMVPPEQAGVWSYPQHGMADAVTTVTLANSVLRRPILSGHLDHMTEAELDRVREFVAAHKSVRDELPVLQSTWPLGLPGWEDSWIAAGLVGIRGGYLTVWRRDADSPERVSIPVGRLLPPGGRRVERVFPRDADGGWEIVGDTLEISLPAPSAVVLRFR
ncbi:alpha-galactosidase [Microbacterium sp. QXD-8]|uniref:Alpha-galactosidase n=1 Tax=Microbacterium psychrotolerans TaxID=3068321 RepID=A0ABU0YW49_9MICO|nr:alpha-galactosidase [Microbacterium sp. QXD-8]MDQ7876532.1 alpha-galactosidase [Microbacterium sp. QXD-8]